MQETKLITNAAGATQTAPTKNELVAALMALGYEQSGTFPPSLKNIHAASNYTPEAMDFARYMVADTDFGGCWNDAEQIEMHTRQEATK